MKYKMMRPVIQISKVYLNVEKLIKIISIILIYIYIYIYKLKSTI